MNLQLIRRAWLPFGVYGLLRLPGFACWTVERPWLGNEPWVSCVPNGEYDLVWHPWSARDGMTVPMLANVPDRSAILIHPANFPHEVQGCIGVGLEPRCMGGTAALGVPDSNSTFLTLKAILMRHGVGGGKIGKLRIEWGIEP